MARRQRILQDFINGVLRTPLFRRCPYFAMFLREEFAKNFTAVKKVPDMQQSIQLHRPLQVEDLQSLTGAIACNSSTKGTYANNANEFLHHSHTSMKKIKKQLEEVKSLFSTVARKMKETAESIKLLAELQASIPEVSPTQAAVHLRIYRDLSEITLKWSDYQLDNSNVVHDELSQFFHRRIAEVKAMKQLLREREQALTDYSKQYRKLDSKKKKLWDNKDTNKWGLAPTDKGEELLSSKEYAFSKMLPAETEQIDRLRKFYNFYNYQVPAEIARVFGDAGELENQHFAALSQKMREMMAAMMEQWREVQSHFERRAELDAD